MPASDDSIPDWANLPATMEKISLWDCVHDGKLLSIESDLLARTLKIKFAVPYLASFHKLPDGLTFALLLEGVKSVRALRFAVWPGEFSMPAGLDRAEQQRRLDEIQSKGREESERWTKLESEVNADDDAELTDGEMTGGDGALALRLGIHTNGEWYDVFVRAEAVSIWRSDQQRLRIDEFVGLGCAYWEAFASRTKKAVTSQENDC